METFTLGCIWAVIPGEWTVWKNQFGDWTLGEVKGDFEEANLIVLRKAKQGTLEELLQFAKVVFLEE